jgi:hypothetical protein
VTYLRKYYIVSLKFVLGIVIKFRGESNVHWTETHSQKSSDGTTEEYTVYLKGSEKYFESKYHLVGGHGKHIISKCHFKKL